MLTWASEMKRVTNMENLGMFRPEETSELNKM